MSNALDARYCPGCTLPKCDRGCAYKMERFDMSNDADAPLEREDEERRAYSWPPVRGEDY